MLKRVSLIGTGSMQIGDGKMQTLDLTGKTILITGGCGAVGQVVVRALAENGASVAVNDILADKEAADLFRALDLQRPNVQYFSADVTDPDAVAVLFDRVERTLSAPDIVCCHAGMVHTYPVTEYPLERFDQLHELNTRSSFVVAQAAARRWMAVGSPGHVIFTTSWVQDVPWPEITPYTMSKAALKALTRGFARELAPHRIRANAIAPGIVASGMARRQWDTDPAYRARAEKAIPLGYLQPPETVANAFLFLCSNLADYMTGSVLLVDGGCSLYPMD
jgi:NAD(P)-dependent dehydrogenase (short-subunit alcohol dehydrogenase family)